MGFDKDYPNRKDRRKQYRGCKVWDTSCRPHGGCSWCESGRLHNDRKRRNAADEEIKEFKIDLYGHEDEETCPECGCGWEFCECGEDWEIERESWTKD